MLTCALSIQGLQYHVKEAEFSQDSPASLATKWDQILLQFPGIENA